MYKHILIAVDGSETGQKGLDHGLSLARALDARVTVMTATEPFPFVTGGAFEYIPSETVIEDYRAGQEEAAGAILGAATQAAERLGLVIDTAHVSDMPPAEAIMDTARSRGCDLITMGSHGRRGLNRIVLGSKTSEVLARCHVPVLVIR